MFNALLSRPAAFGLALLSILGTIGYWWHQGRPVAMVDAPAGKLRCVSYTPFRDDQTPLDPSFVVPAGQIEDDLARLKSVTDCVRTYAVSGGLERVPAAARQVGLKVLMGAWIGEDAVRNAREVATAIQLANQYGDVVRAVIVGNETLLRGELPPERLAALIRQVKTAVSVPVTYADVWEFWFRYRVVAEAVDFLTIHILPYWEDHPVAITGAVQHIFDIYGQVQEKFPGRKILIGETGWPSLGRMRLGAEPSVVNQARFIRGFIDGAEKIDLDHNIIEAFDQPWKRVKEGAVGGYWGLYTNDRQPKFPLTGPVAENPHWQIHLALSLMLGVAPLLGAMLARRHQGAVGWTVSLALALPAGSAIIEQGRLMLATARNLPEWAGASVLIALSALSAALLIPLLARAAEGRGGRLVRPLRVGELIDGWNTGFAGQRVGALMGSVQALAVASGAVLNLGLALDGRYRDFPSSALIVPAVGFALHAWWVGDQRPRGWLAEESWLAGVLLVAALGVGIVEGPRNIQADLWLVTCLLLAVPWLGLVPRRG